MQRRDAEHVGINQRSLPPLDTSALPHEEQRKDAGTAEQQPHDRGSAEPDRGTGFWLHDAPRAGADQSVDHHGQSAGGEDRANRVEAHTGHRWRVVQPRRERQDPKHDHDLGDEHHAPTEVGGAQPADEWTDRDGDGARRRHQSVGAGAVGAPEVRRYEGHDGGHDQRGAQALEDRPADDEDRERLRQRGDERTGAVDHAADHEGALASEDLTELAARDHEGSHHECVQGDGELNPRDRRAHVRCDRRDGHVHDGAVQRHEELRGRQG